MRGSRYRARNHASVRTRFQRAHKRAQGRSDERKQELSCLTVSPNGATDSLTPAEALHRWKLNYSVAVASALLGTYFHFFEASIVASTNNGWPSRHWPVRIVNCMPLAP